MQICWALLKYGYSNFSLTILEYCEPDKCLIREKHYWDIFNPEYNISQDPTAPFSGRKHSEKSKIIMSDAKKGENHPNYGKTIDDETKKKYQILLRVTLIAMKLKKNKKKISDTMVGNTNSKNQPNSRQIEVTDIKNNTTTSYDSIHEAGRALKINESSIRSNLKSNSNKPYKNLYIFAYKK